MAKYGKDRNFSALYYPGQYWYAAMSFVYDHGGADRASEERPAGTGRSIRRRRSAA